MSKYMMGLLAVLFSAGAFAEPVTGWLQTAAGTYDFNDPANWVNGEINGIFGEDLAIEGAQTINLGTDVTLSNGVTIQQTGAFGITFKGLSTKRTVTVNGDITNTGAGMVGFDSNIILDLGGEVRTISSSAAMTISAMIVNGGVIYKNVGQVSIGGSNTYELGTWLRGTGEIVMGNDYAFGAQASALHLCQGARLRSSQKNGYKTVRNGNNLIIEGDCTLGSTFKDLGGIDFSGCELSILRPVTITFNRYTFKFRLATDSPYGWQNVTIACDDDAYPATISFGGLKVDAFESFRVNSANMTLSEYDDIQGTLELWGGNLTLTDSLKLQNATVALRNKSTLKLSTTSGGVLKPVKKIICGGGTIAYSGVAGVDTEYVAEIELDNVHGTPNLAPTSVSGAVTTLRATAFVKGPGAMLNVGTGDYGSSVRFLIQNLETSEILPWARGTDGAFVRYDAEIGVAPFDSEGSDCVTYSDGMTSADLAGKHVTIPNGLTFTPDADVEVKSLFISIASGTPIGESGNTVSISSGAVNFWSTGSSEVKSALNFGTNHGYISFRNAGITKIGGDIKGSNGLTVSDLSADFNTGKDNKGLNFNAATTYSGDTYLNGVIFPMAAGCFPSGADRPGDLYQEGYVNFHKQGNYSFSVNGLYGSGEIMKDNYSMTLYVGSDGSSGSYDGTIFMTKQIALQKLGAGKQVINGDVSQQYSITVNAGELELNGKVYVSNSGNSIIVQKGGDAEMGGVLSGSASIRAPGSVKVKDNGVLFPGSHVAPSRAMTLDENTALSFESGASLKFHIGSDYVSQLICASEVAGTDVEVPVTVDFQLDKSGKWLLMEATSFAPTFKLDRSNGIAGGRLVTQVDAEAGVSRLWYEQTKGFAIILR